MHVSSNERNLRGTASRAPGLVNGYCYGIIQGPRPVPLPHSDARGGAAEDVERSLRYFSYHGGILRLNWACAQARFRTNAGGLQDYFASSAERAATHDAVVRLLCAEFPALLTAKPDAPNGCVFRRVAVSGEVGDASDDAAAPAWPADEVDDASGEAGAHDLHSADLLPWGSLDGDRGSPMQHSDGETEPEHSDDVAGAPLPAQPPEDSEIAAGGRPTGARQARRAATVCPHCSRVFTRPQSLAHHLAYEHAESAPLSAAELPAPPPPKHECPRCGRLFRRRKDCLVHLHGQRCGSRRGKYRAEYARAPEG